MTHRTTGIVRLLSILLLPLAAGCYHETYTYRAVPNVNVARAHELGSSGPLVLVSLDDLPKETDKPKRKTAAQLLEALTADQIARFDPRMAELNRDAATAYKTLQEARARFGANDTKVKDAQAASEKANKAVEDYVRDFKANNRNKITGTPGSPTTATPANEPEPPQTILVGNVYRDFGERGSSVGRTFVLFIDGPPRPGTFWMTNDNSVLITYSAWTAPYRSHIAMVGSVKIMKVEGNKIDAHVALRETSESDSYEWITHYLDPAYWQSPWIINGRHTFTITGKEDPAFRKAAVQWVKPEELQAAAAAQGAE